MTAKSILIIFTIMSFVGLAVFGFLAMGDHGTGHSLSGCIAALQGGTGCSVFKGLADFASFHLNAFKVFSSANFTATTMALLLFLAVIIFSTILPERLLDSGIPKCVLSAVAIYSSGYDFRTPLERSLKSWFALRENSPTLF